MTKYELKEKGIDIALKLLELNQIHLKKLEEKITPEQSVARFLALSDLIAANINEEAKSEEVAMKTAMEIFNN